MPAAPVVPVNPVRVAPPAPLPSPFFNVGAMAPQGHIQPPCADAAQREVTIYLVDISSSMLAGYDGAFSKIESANRAAASMVVQKAHIDAEDEVGIATFNCSGNVVFAPCPVGSHKPQILTAIQSLTASGGTDINEGLKTARDMFDWSRPDVVRRIVLLTDGNGGHPLRTAQNLKDRGVVIDVIGVGPDTSDVDEKLLRKVASVIGGEVRYRFIRDQETLVNYIGTTLAQKTQTA